MNIVLDNYTPLISYLSPASIPQIVAHIQDYLLKHPILSVETVAEIIVQSLQEHPELLNGEAIPISADSEQSIKAYIDALPFLDTYTKAEINQLLLGKQDTLTFDQAPTPGSSNPVTSSGIIAAISALQSALETQIGLKADSASTYTKTQVDTLLEDKADADNVYSKNTIDAKLLEVDTEIDNVNDALDDQSQQKANQGVIAYVETGDNATVKTYTAGEFIVWKGTLYTVNNGGIPLNTAISGHVTAIPEGGLNALFNNLSFKSGIYTNGYAEISNIQFFYNDKIAFFAGDFVKIGGGNIELETSAWKEMGTVDVKPKVEARTALNYGFGATSFNVLLSVTPSGIVRIFQNSGTTRDISELYFSIFYGI